jgi:hypothetical protein
VVPSIYNLGTVLKSAGGGTNLCDFAFNNNGLLNVQIGAVALDAGGSSSGVFSNAAPANVEFTGGTHTLNGGMSIAGAGRGRIAGGTVTLNGDITIGAGTTLELASGVLNGSGALNGTGTFEWTGVAQADLAANTSIAAGMHWLLSGNADNKRLNGGIVRNLGVATWSGTGNLVGIYGGAITNSGEFDMVNDASFTYPGGYGDVPAFENLAGAVLRKSGGTNVTTFGTFLLRNSGVVDIQSGVLSLQAANHTFADGSHLRGLGRIRVDGTAVTLNGNITLETGATFELASGTVNGATTLLGTGTFVWSGGDLSGSMNIAANANLSISGSADKRLNGAVLNQAGSTVWTGSGNLVGIYGAVLTNSGLFDIRTDAAMPYYGGYGVVPSIYNLGTVLKSAGGGTNLCDFAFNNNGTMDLRSGVLALSGGYIPSSTSQLKLAIGGLAPGTQFSQLNLGGAAALAGTLSVALANGFSPTNGSSFAIVDYGSLTSQFSAQQLPALPHELVWKLDYGPSALTLRVQQGPAGLDPVFTTGATFTNFQFDIVGPPASNAIVLVSTNLALPPEKWTGIYTNGPFSGAASFTDTNAPPLPPGVVYGYRVLFQGVTTNAGPRGKLLIRSGPSQ